MPEHSDPTKQSLDLAPYAEGANAPEAYYGLPATVEYCKRCVISNQRPNSAVEYQHTPGSKKTTIHFDDDGICDACRVAEMKHANINWTDREHELRELCDRFRRHDGRYDCVVPGSGGKDSFYAAHVLKYKYGMHPLTVTWAPHMYTDWGWRNFQGWINAGFDNILMTPNGAVHRLLTRIALEQLFHPFQPFVLGQKNIAPKLALKYNIPLIFYGENESEYGNPMATMSSARQDHAYFASADRSKSYLSGVPLSELYEAYGLRENDIEAYLSIDPDAADRGGIEVHYLGYYLKWHPQSCYYYAVENGDFQASPERTPGTYSKYSSIDDRMDDLHYYTTFIKFGIGHASYDAAQEIRSGDITRDEGIALVRRFDGEFPDRFINDIFRYLSIDGTMLPAAARMFERPRMDRPYFDMLCDRFRSPHLWLFDNGQWRLRRTVWMENE